VPKEFLISLTKFNVMHTSDVGNTDRDMNSSLTTLELCAGAGGQALGLELAGIEHVGLIEIDSHACATLRLNRPQWNVMEQDLTAFKDASAFMRHLWRDSPAHRDVTQT
jgi:predicted RNA methylase